MIDQTNVQALVEQVQKVDANQVSQQVSLFWGHIVVAITAVWMVVKDLGRAWQAVKTGSSVLGALVHGTNLSTKVVDAINRNTTATNPGAQLLNQPTIPVTTSTTDLTKNK